MRQDQYKMSCKIALFRSWKNRFQMENHTFLCKMELPAIQSRFIKAVLAEQKYPFAGLAGDEAHFWLNGYVNKQNCCIWSEANPQVYVETPLHPEKLTVWCALWSGGILLQNDEGHNVTVNGDRYRAMITNFFIPELNNHDVRSCGSNKTAQHVTQLVPQSIY
ncbi:transposase [Trichonephila clavipes]|nr:transposase [Trichonephila clavipes]